MPSNYFSRLRGSFREGIQRSYVVLEGSFVDSLEVLPVHGKLLFGKPGLCYRTFAVFNDLNILFQRGTPVAAQSNVQSASQRKNLSVVGAVSRTLSIPSVSGPQFQVCGYHLDNLLTGHHKLPMALSGSNALLGRYYLNNSTSRHRHFFASNRNSNISSMSRSFHSGYKISMSLKNTEQPDSLFPYGHFLWHVAKESGNCNPFIGFDWESVHTSLPTCLSASSAPDVSIDNSVREGQFRSFADSDGRCIL